MEFPCKGFGRFDWVWDLGGSLTQFSGLTLNFYMGLTKYISGRTRYP